jgi:hypothetical protein
MGGGLDSRCVGRVYGADGAVRCTASSAPFQFMSSHKFNIYKVMYFTLL